ncbi:hypothetical protein [Burkholderia thailandensis]|uniref:hypothetical protein n=1 Tax=Burkholderia thailandensis TaxID=57975 RepID=UPI0002F214B2|nr:hypothetical protein [Burkholderia thailandensis]MBS2129567.1 hypothetical protein [Burkholderia thailandensis]MCS3396707.1 hypothetical protein [Burkholderia thailandensis]MCS6469515.1 hypothetical protein [Burkholderia thailandensis]MCS6475882.1 hypothetical protein [Burkholderia thailandensis]MCS6497078.1 hypothetical protein [Burkholderia thailandensis]
MFVNPRAVEFRRIDRHAQRSNAACDGSSGDHDLAAAQQSRPAITILLRRLST